MIQDVNTEKVASLLICVLVAYCGSQLWCVTGFTHTTPILSIPNHFSQKNNDLINIQHAFNSRQNCNLFHQRRKHGPHTFFTTGAFTAEGITTPADLAEFDKEEMVLIFRNLCKPLKVLRAGAAGGHGELQEVIAYKLLAKSQIRLTIAAQAVRFYEDTDRELNPANMLWGVIKLFDEQFKALMAGKKGHSFYVPPKLTKNFSLHR